MCAAPVRGKVCVCVFMFPELISHDSRPTHFTRITPDDDTSSGRAGAGGVGGDDALVGSGSGGALSEEDAAALQQELEALGNHIRFFKNGKDQGPAYSQLIGGASCVLGVG